MLILQKKCVQITKSSSVKTIKINMSGKMHQYNKELMLI